MCGLRKKRGTTSIELAITLYIFLTVFLGIIDFGYYFWCSHVVAHATREGGRVAILGGVTSEEVEELVEEGLQGISDSPEITVSPMISNEPVTVSVEIPFNFFFLPGFIEGFLNIDTISCTVIMVHEP